MKSFVDRPAGFNDLGLLFLDKTNSNASFKVGSEIVYVLHGILTSRSTYFKEMLEGSFKDGQSMAEIVIEGIEPEVFTMLVEWNYTMNVLKLNGFSNTLLFDLERLYVAAKVYLVGDLCETIY